MKRVRFRFSESEDQWFKAWIARVCSAFGPLVQNAGQAQGKDGSDPFAPLLARKIRERLIRHGISHRVGRNASWDSLSSPGLCMPFGRKWARRFEVGQQRRWRGPAFRGRGGDGARQRASLPDSCYFGTAILPQIKIKPVLYHTLATPGHHKVRKSLHGSKSVNSETQFFNNSQTSVV